VPVISNVYIIDYSNCYGEIQGKTMLLNVLAGRIAGGEVQGSVLLNGHPRDTDSWRRTIGYVEQDDLMYQNLTVEETFNYAAKLRLPRSMPWEEKKRRVDQVVSELSLKKCLKTRIGDNEKRGISGTIRIPLSNFNPNIRAGGERKRVSIGVELITRPRLLFLDEPTSGLDAFTAVNIVECVRDLAMKENRAVLMTIHQPRESILSLFSKVILLSQGKVMYFGDIPGTAYSL
jgi:ABC-type multidrug transport system ATPase subunit